jgi:hypothetical protein
MIHFLSPREPTRRPLWVRLLSLNSFKSELKEFPFLSEEEKTNPPTQQTWEEIRNPKLRRHPDCEKILVEELINDHGMEGYVFRVDIDGTGPYVLKITARDKRRVFCRLARRQGHCSSLGGSISNVNVREGITWTPFREGPGLGS